MNLVLWQCSSFPRAGLLGCDLLYELLPSPVHSSSCSLHCSWSCSAGCLTLIPPQILTNAPPASPYLFLPPCPLENGGVIFGETCVCLARRKPCLVPGRSPELPQLFSLCSCPVPAHTPAGCPGGAAGHPCGGVGAVGSISWLAFAGLG